MLDPQSQAEAPTRTSSIAAEAVPTPAKGPWGPWATVVFTLLIAVTFSLVQTILAIPFLVVSVAGSPNADIQAAAASLETNALFFSLAELVAGGVALGLTWLIVWLRKGPPPREYLALRPVPWRTHVVWLLGVLLLGFALDGLSFATGHPIVPDWVRSLYRSSRLLPLTLLAVLGMAPVIEEVVFRGFFLEGVRHSKIGDVGTVVLASLIWASIHLQYEWFHIGQVFILGLVLGAARVRTRSLIPPILMHALFSGVATIEAALAP